MSTIQSNVMTIMNDGKWWGQMITFKTENIVINLGTSSYLLHLKSSNPKNKDMKIQRKLKTL